MQLETFEHISEVYIVDVDGTLMDPTHRVHYLTQDKPDWDSFYEAADGDTPLQDVIDVVERVTDSETHVNSGALVVVSGRRNSIREITRQQLEDVGLYPDVMYLRPDDDRRQDTEVKLEALADIQRRYPNATIKGVFEDRQTVVDMWREQGLTVFQVAPGDF